MIGLLVTVLLGSPCNRPDVPTLWPIEPYRISSEFGYRKMDRKIHPGIDIPARVGTKIKAAADGKVVYVANGEDYGLMVIVDHGNGLKTWYAHLLRAMVRIGTKLRQGQVFAKVGASGKVTGPHLHFEVRSDGVAQNPRYYLSEECR